MSTVYRIDRRTFLTLTGLATGAFVLGCSKPQGGPPPIAGVAQQLDPDAPEHRLNLYVSIDENGTVSIISQRSEMGQGSHTALPAVVADELGADWDKVVVIQADNRPDLGDQNTDGSRSIRYLYEPMRKVAAAARMMLVAAAAERWGVEAGECRVEAGFVHHGDESLGFGELAADASKIEVPADDALVFRTAAELGPRRSKPIVNGVGIVTGTAIFGADVRLPEMVYAAVARPPVAGGKVVSVDDRTAMRIPGVLQIIELEGPAWPPGVAPLGGVAVVATSTWAAFKGRKSLRIEWDDGPNAGYDSAEYRKTLAAGLEKGGRLFADRGDVDEAIAGAAKTIESTYWVPLLSQSPMEPPCAVAKVDGDIVEVWAPTQEPQWAARDLAAHLGVEEANVTVHVTYLGGGFGRKSKPDFVVEAALVAKEVGKPVCLTWSREDDTRHGFYNSMALQTMRGGLDDSGRCIAWHHKTLFPPIGTTFSPEVVGPGESDLMMGPLESCFDLPNYRVETGEARPKIRIGWMRSVANVYHAFAMGGFVGELAAAAGKDQLETWRELIGEARIIDLAAEGIAFPNYGGSPEDYPLDAGRLRGVLDRVAEAIDWGRELPEGRGLGIACHRSFLSYTAVALEVSMDGDRPVVHRAAVGIDCGLVASPDRVLAQLEGSLAFGLSLAFYGQITARNGAVEQSNFNDHPILSISEMPKQLDLVVVESDGPPAGVGEPAVPPVAPALTNAIFAAIGKRITELPILGKKS